jgi:bifunctional DNase/RNase
MLGTVAVPLAAAGTLAILVAAAGSTAPSPDASVEVEVAAVLPMPEGPAGLLVLRERRSGTLLPVLVPDGRALSSAQKKQHALADAGLLGRTIEALGAQVQEVEIVRAEETPTATRVRLRQGAHDVEVAARPSESVSLAVAAGARIVTTRRLLDTEGLTPGELEEASRKAARGDDTPL